MLATAAVALRDVGVAILVGLTPNYATHYWQQNSPEI